VQEAVEFWVREGIDKAMSRFNAAPAKPATTTENAKSKPDQSPTQTSKKDNTKSGD
jgi:hypothetical protein